MEGRKVFLLYYAQVWRPVSGVQSRGRRPPGPGCLDRGRVPVPAGDLEDPSEV